MGGGYEHTTTVYVDGEIWLSIFIFEQIVDWIEKWEIKKNHFLFENMCGVDNIDGLILHETNNHINCNGKCTENIYSPVVHRWL